MTDEGYGLALEIEREGAVVLEEDDTVGSRLKGQLLGFGRVDLGPRDGSIWIGAGWIEVSCTNEPLIQTTESVINRLLGQKGLLVCTSDVCERRVFANLANGICSCVVGSGSGLCSSPAEVVVAG